MYGDGTWKHINSRKYIYGKWIHYKILFIGSGFRLPHPTTLPVTTITQGFTSHTLTGPTVDAPSGLRSLPEGLCVHIGPHTPHTASPVGSNLGRARPPTRPSRQGGGLLQQQQRLSYSKFKFRTSINPVIIPFYHSYDRYH